MSLRDATPAITKRAIRIRRLVAPAGVRTARSLRSLAYAQIGQVELGILAVLHMASRLAATEMHYQLQIQARVKLVQDKLVRVLRLKRVANVEPTQLVDDHVLRLLREHLVVVLELQN